MEIAPEAMARSTRRQILRGAVTTTLAALAQPARAEERTASPVQEGWSDAERGHPAVDQEDNEVRVGIVGCSEGTHGKVWAEMLASPDGKRFGMTPARVWDADPEAARIVARATGAVPTAAFPQVGDGMDGVLITELMPDRYLKLGRPFLEAGMRVFFNRPFAGSVRDAKEILRIARANGARVYSASALFHTAAGEVARRKLGGLGPVRLFNMTGASDHVGFYLPHAIAALVSVLGTGIVTVKALSLTTQRAAPQHAAAPVVVYAEYGPRSPHAGARGVIEMIGPGAKWYGFVVKLFGAGAEADEVHFEVTYDRLLQNMAAFFRTGTEPVPHEVLLEKTAIYYGALESSRHGGRAVSIPELLRV